LAAAHPDLCADPQQLVGHRIAARHGFKDWNIAFAALQQVDLAGAASRPAFE